MLSAAVNVLDSTTTYSCNFVIEIARPRNGYYSSLVLVQINGYTLGEHFFKATIGDLGKG